jgi:excisionase family DNA binding protein
MIPEPRPHGLALLSVDALAARLGLDVKTVYASLARGEIPARRVGRRWIIVEQVIDQWLATPPDRPPMHPIGPKSARSARGRPRKVPSDRQAPSSERHRR